jgi:CHASE3 domain sensor protein
MTEPIWNVDTLKVLMDERQEHLKELRVADQRAIDAALVSQEKAIVKAETAADKRFELLNELRGGVATKEQLEGLEKIVADLKDRLTNGEGIGKGSQITTNKIYAALAAAVGVIGLVVLLANGVFK